MPFKKGERQFEKIKNMITYDMVSDLNIELKPNDYQKRLILYSGEHYLDQLSDLEDIYKYKKNC